MEERGAAEREVTVVLVDDEAIRALNRDHRGVDAPTDVLSYPTHEPDDVGVPEVPHLGDVFISLETASRQAEVHRHSPDTEVALLAAHGLLHLLGFDHETEAAWDVFENAQQQMVRLFEAATTSSS